MQPKNSNNIRANYLTAAKAGLVDNRNKYYRVLRSKTTICYAKQPELVIFAGSAYQN